MADDEKPTDELSAHRMKRVRDILSTTIVPPATQTIARAPLSRLDAEELTVGQIARIVDPTAFRDGGWARDIERATEKAHAILALLAGKKP